MSAPVTDTMAPRKQHLIDPEICIRCNTCEETCPVGAVTHDDNNYVVNVGSRARLGTVRDTATPRSNFDP